MMPVYLIWMIILLLVCPMGCVTDDQFEEIDFVAAESEESTADKVEPALSPSQRLEQVAPRGSRKAEVVMDIYALLDAEEQLANGQKDKALVSYKDALKLAKGPFSRLVFKEWTQLYLASFGNEVDLKAAAKLVWTETDNGSQVDYFTEDKISTEERLEVELGKLLDDSYVKKIRDENVEQKNFPNQGYVKDDPLLRKHANAYCRESENPEWSNWINQLPSELRLYWEARIAHCKAEFTHAAALYEKFIAISRTRKFKKTGNQALESAYRLTDIYRWIDRRRELAQAYATLVVIWDEAKIDQSMFDEGAEDFKLRKINDHLWSARYGALIGEFDLAERHANHAIKLAEKLELTRSLKKTRQIATVKEYRAEGHHILAFRIALERGKIESAVAQTDLGLTIKDLNDDWTNRFKWYRGFYQYLSGDFEKSRKFFEEFLSEMDDDNSYRDRVFYWLARSYQRLNREDEANFYLNALQQEYPASFYNVVPVAERDVVLMQSKMDTLLGLKTDLDHNLKNRRRFDLSLYKKDEKLRRLLLRAQLLAKAKIDYYAKIVVNNFTAEARKETQTMEQWVYLSRLNYLVGNYFQAIVLTAEINRQYPDLWKVYPEQILIHYPMAFMEHVQKHSLEHGIEAEDILAVTRQESSFRAQIRSPAGALGLMQLMPQTALRLLDEMNRNPPGSIEEMLANAENNIELGASLLKRLFNKYQGRRPPAFAAYNAGEYVVDIWLQRRNQEDPLVWVEVIPFGETQNYVKSVWRNYHVYKYLRYRPARLAQLLSIEALHNEWLGAEPTLSPL